MITDGYDTLCESVVANGLTGSHEHFGEAALCACQEYLDGYGSQVQPEAEGEASTAQS